jgi:GTP-binding protein
LDFIQLLGTLGIPFVLVFTKTDKQSLNKTQEAVAAYRKKLSETWEEIPQMFITSSAEKKGREEILDFIESVNNELNK